MEEQVQSALSGCITDWHFAILLYLCVCFRRESGFVLTIWEYITGVMLYGPPPLNI